MADIEKVINGLECCQMVYECKPYEKCPYSNGLECGDCDINRLHYDALALLKEHEAELQKGRYYSDVFDIGYKAGKESIVRCKDCKHRPIKPNDYENGFDLKFPDNKCPCQNGDDGWYSWYPADNWFCPDGERKEDK